MKSLPSLVGVGLAIAILSVTPAAATDVPISGAKLKISDVTQPGSVRRKIVSTAKDAAVVVPADGSAADPSLNGGILEVANTAGSGESAAIALPSGNWLRLPSDPSKPVKGWKYKEVLFNPPTDDYKIKVIIKQTYSAAVLRIAVKDDRGSVIAYTLDEPSQGSVGVRLETGADRHCTDFGGTVVTDLSEDLGGSVYRGTFVAKAAPTPPDCGSPSGAFLD